MTFAACGNQGSNTPATPTPAAKSEEAPAKVAYEQITVEKYGVTFDILKGMRRTDNPASDDGGVWTLVPEDDNDFPIYATVQAGVYESMFGPYDDERIQREFDEDIPAEAEKKLDLEKKEYTYSVAGEISEFHRVIFKDNKQINIMVAYTEKKSANSTASSSKTTSRLISWWPILKNGLPSSVARFAITS